MEVKVLKCCAICNFLYDKEECPLYRTYEAANRYGDETFDESAKYKVNCYNFVLDEKLKTQQ